MTREETLKIMAVLKATYPNFYKDMTRRDAEGVVALWTDMFAEDSYNAVAAAVKAFIASDNKGFPPVVGQVKQRVTELASAKALPGNVSRGSEKEAAWMRRYINVDHGGLGRISRYARKHGITWDEAKAVLHG